MKKKYNNRLLRLPAVMDLTGQSKPTIYRLMKSGDFPQNVKISERSVAWSEKSVQAWIQSRIAA
jgi:prophage regulatory protein